MKTFLAVAAVGALALAMLVFRPPKPAEPAVRFDAAPSSRPMPSTPVRSVVYVAGRVVRPGLYTLPAGARVDDALRAAGGVARGGDAAAVNPAARIGDGDEIVVPPVGGAPPAVRHRAGRQPRRAKRRRRTAPSSSPVDVNRAGVDALSRVPGIDRALARRIVAVRLADGPFTDLEDLEDVAGISPTRLKALAPHLVVQ